MIGIALGLSTRVRLPEEHRINFTFRRCDEVDRKVEVGIQAHHTDLIDWPMQVLQHLGNTRRSLRPLLFDSGGGNTRRLGASHVVVDPTL